MKKEVKKLKVMERANSADIFLYGAIGTDWSKPPGEQNTDENIVSELDRLGAKYPRINLRINSPGGSMLHGNAVISAIQRSPAEIHAYNDGVAASMAADIFMAAPHRHMAKTSLLMIHKPTTGCYGDDQDMEACAAMLRTFASTAIGVMAECTGKTEEEVTADYYDGADHWIARKDCVALGIVNETDEYDAAAPPKDIEKMSFPEVLAMFEQNEKSGQERPKNWLQKITAAFWDAHKSAEGMDTPIVHHIEEEDMVTIDTIKAAMAAGEIKTEDLQALLPQKSAEPAPDAPAAPAAPAPAAQEADPMKAILDRFTALEQRIDKFAAAPGSGKSFAAFPEGDDGDDARDPLKEMNEELYASVGHQQRFVAN